MWCGAGNRLQGRAALSPHRAVGGRGVVDTHAHLESCDAPIAELLAEAAAAGVRAVISIGVGRESSERAVALAEAARGRDEPEVFAAVGVHPHDADGFGGSDLGWLGRLAASPRVVAIGECGLDFYRDHSSHEAQHRAFEAQIGLAREVDLPLVIHTREATEATLDVLAREARGLTVVLHCFSLSDHVDEVARRGYYASFAGPLTYRSAGDLRAAAIALPDDRLLVETDSPYLAPVPRRGRPNRPANVAHTLAALAEVRGCDVAQMDRITTRNARAAFPRLAAASL